ncbi:hypothetical protein IFM89_035578 [Coptis chinensis]|uniref:Uncharacterized protein n=1 Tax=Coptis chinensis TaxID=261450 RepID=A0A835HWI8_9MAGN|nr:hypothetical protein IFM89_035578 [Coptis chinensis]
MALQSFSSHLSLSSTQTSSLPYWKCNAPSIKAPSLTSFPVSLRTLNHPSLSKSRPFSISNPQCLNDEEEGGPQGLVQDLRVPDHWLVPAKALQESEWLRITLHKWLDDEYCPETTNEEISKVAANSYYDSLVVKRSDLGEILLKIARDLESISYQESFHGAFSSANAAVSLIVGRIEQEFDYLQEM